MNVMQGNRKILPKYLNIEQLIGSILRSFFVLSSRQGRQQPRSYIEKNA